MQQLCSCGHERPAHEHWRAGTDCAFCSCPRYHAALGMTAGARDAVRRLLGSHALRWLRRPAA